MAGSCSRRDGTAAQPAAAWPHLRSGTLSGLGSEGRAASCGSSSSSPSSSTRFNRKSGLPAPLPIAAQRGGGARVGPCHQACQRNGGRKVASTARPRWRAPPAVPATHRPRLLTGTHSAGPGAWGWSPATAAGRWPAARASVADCTSLVASFDGRKHRACAVRSLPHKCLSTALMTPLPPSPLSRCVAQKERTLRVASACSLLSSTA